MSFCLLSVCLSRLDVCVCMYVCIEVTLRAFQLGQGEGPIGLVGPISQPRGTIDIVSLMLDHTSALVCVFWSSFILGNYGSPVSSCRRYSDTPGLWHTQSNELITCIKIINKLHNQYYLPSSLHTLESSVNL